MKIIRKIASNVFIIIQFAFYLAAAFYRGAMEIVKTFMHLPGNKNAF